MKELVVEMFNCVSFPNLLMSFVICGSALLAAYLVYHILFFFLCRAFPANGLGITIVRALRPAARILFLAVSLLIALLFIPVPPLLLSLIRHVLALIVIGTIGGGLIALISACKTYIIEKIGDSATADPSHRSFLTQTILLYRVLIVGIVLLTLAGMLLTFPYIKNIGVGILGSAGVAGLVLGMAARPLLQSMMAGFQITTAKILKIGDAVFIENNFARIEAIYLTHVIVRTWDLRRMILPISYFLEKPFENWDVDNPELLASFFVYCDYQVCVDKVREKVKEVVEEAPEWNKKLWRVHMTDCKESTVELRVLASANDATNAFELKAKIREKLVDFLQKEFPDSLPRVRYSTIVES